MHKGKLLIVGDHFIPPELMRLKLGETAAGFDVVEATTPFPLEPFRDIAEVKEASGSEEQMIDALRDVSICVVHHAPLTERVLTHAPNLRLFVGCRGGPVNVNVGAATRSGVTIAYTPARKCGGDGRAYDRHDSEHPPRDSGSRCFDSPRGVERRLHVGDDEFRTGNRDRGTYRIRRHRQDCWANPAQLWRDRARLRSFCKT